MRPAVSYRTHAARGGRRETLKFVEPYDFRRVSVTALIPAYARGEYTDIPYAKEMLEVLRSRNVSLGDGPWSEGAMRDFASFFEARFKSVSRILEERGAAQVLELAAGLSPRGMALAQRGIKYVEMDLAESVAIKRGIVAEILGQIPAELSLCAAGVLHRDEFLQCASAFGGGPIAVTTEGLLRYLTFDEKRQLAANVHELLSRHGGMWITTDIHLRQFASHGRRTAIDRAKETERLGRNLDPNYFDNLEHARAFFEECGFRVESRPLLEGIRDSVVSLPHAPAELLEELNARRTFVLHV